MVGEVGSLAHGDPLSADLGGDRLSNLSTRLSSVHSRPDIRGHHALRPYSLLRLRRASTAPFDHLGRVYEPVAEVERLGWNLPSPQMRMSRRSVRSSVNTMELNLGIGRRAALEGEVTGSDVAPYHYQLGLAVAYVTAGGG